MVYSSHQKMSGAHRKVGHTEIEKSLAGFILVQCVESEAMLRQGRFECVVKKVSNSKILCKKSAGSLTCTGAVMKVNASLAHERFFSCAAGAVITFLVNCEVGLCNG